MLYLNWRGSLVRLSALAVLALALAAPLALATTPLAQASCGTRGTHQCGPCSDITAADLNTPQTSARGGAWASLSRTRGAPGTAVTLNGSGWPAGATVQLFMAVSGGNALWLVPQPFAQGVASASGRVTVGPFRAPQSAGCDSLTTMSGQNGSALFVAQTPDGHARYSLRFTYTPSPQVVGGMQYSSQEVTVGQLVTLMGSGWEPGALVTITPALLALSDSAPASYTMLTADAHTVQASPDGSFTLAFHIPEATIASRLVLFASSNGPRDGDLQFETFVNYLITPVNPPTLTLAPASGQTGVVLLSGTNWPPNQTLVIAYCRGRPLSFQGGGLSCDPRSAQVIDTTSSDAYGVFSAPVELPPNARPGDITIQVSIQSQPFSNAQFDAQARPWTIIARYPWAVAHPRQALALRALPYVIFALMVGLIALGAWRAARRRRTRSGEAAAG